MSIGARTSTFLISWRVYGQPTSSGWFRKTSGEIGVAYAPAELCVGVFATCFEGPHEEELINGRHVVVSVRVERLAKKKKIKIYT